MDLSPDVIRQLFGFAIQPPPPGVTPNFDNAESNGDALSICAGICFAVILAAVSFKVAAKCMASNKKITWADGMLFFSVAGVISWIAMLIAIETGHAFGRHSWDVKLGYFTKQQLVLSELTSALYPLWILTIKLSVLLMYLELFYRKRWLRYWCYAAMAVMTLGHLAFVFIWSISCRARGGTDQAAYLSGFLAASCAKGKSYSITQSIFNLVGDIFLMVLPLPAIWGLNMNAKKKLQVSSMFLTGFCAIVATSVALNYRLYLLDAEQDNTWKATYVWVASSCEMTAGIVVVCIPSMPAVTKKYLPILSSKVSFTWASLSSRSKTTTTSANATASQRSRWFKSTLDPTTKESSSSVSSITEPVPAVTYEKSKFWDGQYGNVDGSNGYFAHAISDPNSDSSSGSEVGLGEIKKTTGFNVKVVER